MKMEIDSDGDELCHIRDPETREAHKILLREAAEDGQWAKCINWHPLWRCDECCDFTGGKCVCEVCLY